MGTVLLSLGISSVSDIGSGITNEDTFAGVFQRTFFVPQNTTYTFSIRTDDQGNVYLDGEADRILMEQNV